MLKIGIVGYGFVGRAMRKVFEHNATTILVDPVYTTRTIQQLCADNPSIIFVCLPAPTLDNGSVDSSLIYNTFKQLADATFTGIVILKSTLPPATVIDLYNEYGLDRVMNKTGPLRYIYSPEFLTENNWEYDVINPDMIILAGNYFDCKLLEEIYLNHSHVNRQVKFTITDHMNASLIKYTINTFLATKVAFMNQIYQLYTDLNGAAPTRLSWDNFVDMLTDDIRIGDSHMTVPGHDGKFGYGGTCFPKDIKAMHGFDKNNRLTVLKEVELSNTQIRLTQK